MEIKIHIKNLAKVQAALKKSPQVVSKYADQAIKRSIYQIQREVIPRTPVDRHRLRNFWDVGIKFRTLYGEIYNNVEYAIYVHEILKNKHKVGEAKFLEKAVNASRGEIEKNFEWALEKSLTELANLAS